MFQMMEGDKKQSWQEGLMETFDGVEAAEEERNVKESGPDRIDDAFQPHILISWSRDAVA